MPVEKEYSIIADSTISSSPQGHVDGASALPIKRPARTYGRRREEPPVEEAESFVFTSSSFAPGNIGNNTALLEVVPSSSPRNRLTGALHTTSDDEEISGASPKFIFDWKKKFQQMDEDDDNDDVATTSATIKENDATARRSFGQPSLLQQSATTSLASDTSSEDQIPPQSLPSVSHDLFGDDSLSQENQSSPSVKEVFSLSSPQVAPRARARLSNVIHDSDSEPGPLKASSSTTPSSSSQPLHNINTPKSRSLSTTPPTSDDEMQAQIAAKVQPSGKRKFIGHSRPSIPPLDLVEGPLSEPKIRPGTKNRSKVKAPTKKDRQEMLKERTRLAAGSVVSIPRETVYKYTIEGLFAKIRGPGKQLAMSAPTLEQLPLSDPIETYSSPINPRGTSSGHVASTSYLARTKVSTSKDLHSPTGNDSDSDDLPEVSEVIKGVEVQKNKQDLQEKKKRAMEILQSTSTPKRHQVDSDDDDLQIVNSNVKVGVKEEEGRRSAKKDYMSQTRKQQMQLARVNPAKHKRNEDASLFRAHGNGEGSSVILHHSGRYDQVSLSRTLAAQAQVQAREVAQRKANEWKKHGGHLPAQPGPPTEGLATALQTIAEKGIKAAEAGASNRMDVDADDDDDDEDWEPTLRGSASPEPVENDENMLVEQDITMVDVDDSEEAEEVKVHATRRMVVVSDDEDENAENRPLTSNRYRRATSSVELPTEDEYDKENNTQLMYDRSDDKENTAVVRHTPLASSSRSIFDIVSPPSPDGVPRELNFRNERLGLNNESSWKSRRPFRELLSDESPSSTQRGPSTLTQSFAAQLQQASPLASTLSLVPTLKPFIEAGLSSEKSFSGFSQFSEHSDPDVFAVAPLLEPGFSDLFESTTQKQRSPTGVDKGKARARVAQAVSDDEKSRNLKRSDTLDLTQDVSVAIDLQPAFQVAENLMRKADAIFEKEQAYVVESALHKPSKKPELYINDHGFLTQTKPTDATPEVYRSQPAFAGDILRGSMLSPSQSRPRAPLRTLSISSTFQPDSPEQQPLRRLRKNVQHSPGSDRVLGSSTTPPPKQNAFDLLARGAAKAHKRDDKKRSNVDLSEFFENEAAESDEENNKFGMVVRKADDEENEEDLDQTLDVLMDDKEMDEETVAAERVLEKYKEQEEEQDKKDQELHEAAISGRLRLKRNRGVGIDDSDEESDDDDNERARRAMKKLRSSDRGDIKDLEANEATRPFAEAYIQSLKDDDEELSYLAVESNLDDLLDDNRASYDPEREDGEEEDDEDEQETISLQEIGRRARQMMEGGVEEPQIDPLDVSWVDKDPEDDVPRVKTIRSRQRVPAPRHDMDSLDMDGALLSFGKPAEQFNASSKQWYAQESKSRNAGTSRSVGGSAITGHAKAKTGTGTGTIHKGPRQKKSESASTSGSKSLRPERSMLSAIADKSHNFK